MGVQSRGGMGEGTNVGACVASGVVVGGIGVAVGVAVGVSVLPSALSGLKTISFPNNSARPSGSGMGQVSPEMFKIQEYAPIEKNRVVEIMIRNKCAQKNRLNFS